MSTVLILHNIRSVHNVGSLFRTADAAGVEKIFLCGTTPAPIDRFGRKRKDLAKVALGAEESVPWEAVLNTMECIDNLKRSDVEVVSLEQSPKSIDYRRYTPNGTAALIVGNEVDGIPEEILSESDMVIEIPMHGAKESLNVAVATGIALFSLRSRD